MKEKILKNGDTITISDDGITYNAGVASISFGCTDESVYQWIDSYRDFARELDHYYEKEILKIKSHEAGMVEYKALVEKI